MEYGIGVQNRYALFLDSDEEGPDPYALLTGATAVDDPKAGGAKAATGAGGKSLAGKPVGAKQAVGGGQQRNPAAAGALTENKANVAANNQAGRPNNRNNTPRTGGAPQQRQQGGQGYGGNQRYGSGGDNQENRTQRSPRPNYGQQQRSFGGNAPEGGNVDGNSELKEGSGGRDYRNRDGRVRNGFGNGPRGPRGGSGSGGGQGGARFNGKRDFNRHSGSDRTGVKATDKRDGAGAHNWGKAGDDFTAEDEALANGALAAGNTEPGAADGATNAGPNADGTENASGEGEDKTGDENGEPKSDEPQLKTLDEYKREREEKRIATQFNIRKANEGEDKSKWKKTYVLKKKVIPDEEEVEYEEIEVEEDPSKRRGRQILDIEVNFRPSEEGRDVVRRGGPRGGGMGGRGGPRGPPRGDRAPFAGRDGEQQQRTPRGPPREGQQEGGQGQGGGQQQREQRGGYQGRGGQGGPRGGPRGPGGRFQATPKFDDLNDFPSL